MPTENPNTILLEEDLSPKSGPVHGSRPPAPPIEIPSEDDGFVQLNNRLVDPNKIQTPTWRDKARALKQQAQVVKAVAGAYVDEHVSTPLSRVHSVSTIDTSRNVHDRTERVVAEVTGFTSGAIRAISGTVAGLTSGLAVGAGKGTLAGSLATLRARDNADDLRYVGHWTETIKLPSGSASGIKMVLFEKIIETAPFQSKVILPTAGARRENITIRNVPTSVLAIPVLQENVCVGVILIAETDRREVYVFLDSVAQA